MRRKKTCKECGAKPLPNETRCKKHKRANALREAARRAARKLAGKCIRCEAKAIVDDDGEVMAYCDEHRAENDARRLAARQRRERERERERQTA